MLSTGSAARFSFDLRRGLGRVLQSFFLDEHSDDDPESRGPSIW